MKKIAIIGAGISGLYIANLFKDHKDYQVTIYEKRNSIEIDEGYGIQLSVNSVKLLNKIGFTSLTKEEKFNPNGSIKNIAGIFNKEKNVLGMMPHPERMIDNCLSGEDGSIFFNNLINNLK